MKELNIKETIEAIKKIERSRLASAGNVDLMGVRPLSSKSSAMLGQLCKPLIDRGIMKIDCDSQRTVGDMIRGWRMKKIPNSKAKSFLNEVINFKGLGNCDCCCHAQIFENENKYYVALTDLPENKGTSVTNFYEKLATDIRCQYLPDITTENICWLQRNLKGVNGYEKETFDLVHLTVDSGIGEFSSPQWKPFNDKKVIKLIRQLPIKENKK